MELHILRTRHIPLYLIAATLVFLTAPAFADTSAHDWSGLYAGAHVGLELAQFSHDEGVVSPDGNTAGGMLGAQAGYAYQTGQHVFGFEMDGSVMNMDDNFLNFSASHFTEDWMMTMRGRYGYSMGNWMPYGTLGLALTQTTAQLDNIGESSKLAVGYAVGGGAEFALTDQWVARAELLVTKVPKQNYTVGTTPMSLESLNESFRIGMSYSFGDLFHVSH